MNILYIGDIMGGPGVSAVESVLPKLKAEKKIDIVIAQAENVTGGKGISVSDYKHLKEIGIDFFTGGNWTGHLKEIEPYLNDPKEPIIRPANYPEGTPGLGYKYLDTTQGKLLVISLLGKIVGRDADLPMDNPLKKIDEILEKEKDVKKVGTVVNFHGDYSSEKVVIGHYLDGRVSAVIGDHWHVPTADARILPKGTAHITDVGMCGILNSSLGIKLQTIIDRWKSGHPSKNILEDEDSCLQFNALYIELQNKKVSLIQKIINNT